MAAAAPLRIIRIQVENFKRLIAVELRPDGKSMVIGGRNAQGKSSLLDSIAMALGGAKRAPSLPLRTGARRGKVRVDLGEYIVTRAWTDGSDKLTVEDPEGRLFKSPQTMLDKIVGDLSFDPLAFARMEAREQAATLRQLVGVDTTQLDIDAGRVFAERTALNREVKAIEGQIAGMPAEPDPITVGEEVSVADLARRHQAASDEYTSNNILRSRLGDAERDAERALDFVRAAARAVEEAQRRLHDAEAASLAAEQRVREQREAVAALIDPDLAALVAGMSTAEQHNAGVRSRSAMAARAREVSRQRDERRRALEDTAARSEDCTLALRDIADRKLSLLASATFPVPGLSVDGDTVTFKGVPFAQASSAEQVRVGLAIGAALNPRLRVVLVKDGSLLDDDTLQALLAWSDANGLQVWIETVGDRGVGVVIEDGRVWDDGSGTGVGASKEAT